MESFGRWLAQQRELRGMTTDEVARVTRISPLAIQALEHDRWDDLPGKAFVVGYLRTYASCVGLDADEVVVRFEEAVAGAEAPAPAAVRRRRSKMPVVVGMSLVALAIVLWLVLR